jgi:hypothetical protein
MPGRIDPTHKLVKLADAGLSTAEGWDDEITFNTQARRLLQPPFTILTIRAEIFAMGQPCPLAR